RLSRIGRRRSYSSISPRSARSPVTSTTAGRGSGAVRCRTARSQCCVVWHTWSILLPGAAMCRSLICATTMAVMRRGSVPRLQRGQEVVHALLGVAEQHHRLRVVVELVLDAREAGVHAPLEDDDGLPAVDLEDGHPVERAR